MAVRIEEVISDIGPAAGNTSISNRPRWSPDRGLRPWSSDPSSVVRMYGRGGAPHKSCASLSDTMMAAAMPSRQPASSYSAIFAGCRILAAYRRLFEDQDAVPLDG